MNPDEKPRPSVGDTLRAALPMKWLIALQNAMGVIWFATLIGHAKTTVFLQNSFGFSHDFAENCPFL